MNKHDWRDMTDRLGVWACASCGVVRSDWNGDAECRGKVKVETRPTQEPHGDPPITDLRPE